MAQADIDALKVAVEAEGSAVTAAVTLIEGLAQQIRDSLDDPAELKALADSINSQAKALADAVVANTPASPTP